MRLPPRAHLQTEENGDLFSRLTEIDGLVSALRSELAMTLSSHREMEEERDCMKVGARGHLYKKFYGSRSDGIACMTGACS